MTRLWIVRAGKHGERELAAIEHSKLYPGFEQVGDLRESKDREAIHDCLNEAMPDAGANRRRNFAAQLNQFVNTIQLGDLVVMRRKVTNGVASVELTGGYSFDANGAIKHTSPVQLFKERV